MRRTIRLAGAVVLALCAGGILAGSAAASPTLHLFYSGSTELTVGHEVEGYDTSWQLTSAEGNVSCVISENNEGFLGKDSTNNQKTDLISVESVFGGFYDDSSGCTSTVAGFTPVNRGIWFNGNTNSPGVAGEFKLGTKGTGEYASTAAKDTVAAIENTSGELCFWEVKKLKGTQLPGPPVNVSFKEQKVKLLKEVLAHKSPKACPKKATISTSVAFYIPLGGGAEAELEGST